MYDLDGAPPKPPPRPSVEVVYERKPLHLLEAVVERYYTLVGPFKKLEGEHLVLIGLVAIFFLFVALNVAVALVALAAPALAIGLLAEHWPRYRRTPRRIVRDDVELVSVPDRFGGKEVRIRFEEVRRVYPSDTDLLIRYQDGRADRLDWLLAARQAVLLVLQDAVMLQPHGGEPGALVPLLHVPPDERDLVGLALPTGDADCPACGRHMPSPHWFAIDRARRQVVCIDCAARPPSAPLEAREPEAAAEG